MAGNRPEKHPEYRISDAERREALDALSEHLSTGRLDIAEFDTRSAQASAATLRHELEPLFADLPEPRPSVLVSSHSVTHPIANSSTTWRQSVAASAVPVAAIIAVLLFFTVARGVIFVFLLPALVALLIGPWAANKHR